VQDATKHNSKVIEQATTKPIATRCERNLTRAQEKQQHNSIQLQQHLIRHCCKSVLVKQTAPSLPSTLGYAYYKFFYF
jgi:hypothetical protein